MRARIWSLTSGLFSPSQSAVIHRTYCRVLSGVLGWCSPFRGEADAEYSDRPVAMPVRAPDGVGVLRVILGR
jgi:hypothetical protein